MDSELDSVQALAHAEGLHTEMDWANGCVYVYMQYDPDEEPEATPVYSYLEMVDLLGG